MLSDLLYRVRSLFRTHQVESELDDELRFHFERQVEANFRSGMTRQQSLRAARLQFGGFDQVKEECRDARGVNFIGSLAQDIRFAARMLLRSPGFAIVAILTLALGIGTNTAIFSYVDAWLIKGLPFPHSSQLVLVKARDIKKGWIGNVLTPGDFLSLRDQAAPLSSISAWNMSDFNLSGEGTPERVQGALVSSSFFDVLGVTPMLGRAFLPQEERLGANHVAIISRGLWASRFASDPQIIGRKITVDGETCTVVGVAPANFQMPLMGVANVWMPMAWTDAERASREGVGYGAIARMKPESNLSAANMQLKSISAQLERDFPATNENELFYLAPLRDEIAQEEGGDQVLVCFWIVGLVLLIACANVANLMIARASGRTKEIAVRSALGATRGRIARQLLTESAILFSLGGAAGVLFGVLGMSWIDSLIPERSRGYLVNYGHVDLDLLTLSYALGLAFICGIVFGLAPALQASKLDLNGALKEAAGRISGGKRGMRMRRIFVAGEVAVAVVVLISTALLVQSFVHMANADPGFRPANLITTQIDLPKNKYPADAQVRAFFDQALERMRALPQVESASLTRSVPFTGLGDIEKIYRADQPVPAPNDTIYAQYSAISPDYFSTAGIPLRSGRVFTKADDTGTANVAIINDRLRKQLWPDSDPIGQQVVLGDARTVVSVVGVVGDVKMNQISEKPRRELYLPFAQAPTRSAGFVIRSSGNDETLAAAMRDAIWSVDAQQPVSKVSRIDAMIADVLGPNLILSQLAGFFGLLALFLGAIGIYGVMSHSVAQRTNEIGIRMALGASPRQLIRLVVGEGLKLAIVGIAVGLLLALALTRSMASILFNVKTSDPIIFTAVAILFAAVAAAACSIPAWRALRVDPTVALRCE
jgi:putative ABC transport system permease protein